MASRLGCCATGACGAPCVTPTLGPLRYDMAKGNLDRVTAHDVATYLDDLSTG